jgi:hypothetical protein
VVYGDAGTEYGDNNTAKNNGADREYRGETGAPREDQGIITASARYPPAGT